MTDRNPFTDRDLVAARHRENATERIRAAAEGLNFTAVMNSVPDAGALVEFRACFESFAFASFDIAGLTDAFRVAMQSVSRGGWGLVDGYVITLLASPALRAVLPDLAVVVHHDPHAPLAADTYGSLDPLLLEGSLAAALRDGGPYRQVPARHAVSLAHEFRANLFGDRFDDIHVTISSGWSTWFHNESWDHAWIITDYHLARAHILCVSGND